MDMSLKSFRNNTLFGETDTLGTRLSNGIIQRRESGVYETIELYDLTGYQTLGERELGDGTEHPEFQLCDRNQGYATLDGNIYHNNGYVITEVPRLPRPRSSTKDSLEEDDNELEKIDENKISNRSIDGESKEGVHMDENKETDNSLNKINSIKKEHGETDDNMHAEIYDAHDYVDEEINPVKRSNSVIQTQAEVHHQHSTFNMPALTKAQELRGDMPFDKLTEEYNPQNHKSSQNHNSSDHDNEAPYGPEYLEIIDE